MLTLYPENVGLVVNKAYRNIFVIMAYHIMLLCYLLGRMLTLATAFPYLS